MIASQDRRSQDHLDLESLEIVRPVSRAHAHLSFLYFQEAGGFGTSPRVVDYLVFLCVVRPVQATLVAQIGLTETKAIGSDYSSLNVKQERRRSQTMMI